MMKLILKLKTIQDKQPTASCPSVWKKKLLLFALNFCWLLFPCHFYYFVPLIISW